MGDSALGPTLLEETFAVDCLADEEEELLELIDVKRGRRGCGRTGRFDVPELSLVHFNVAAVGLHPADGHASHIACRLGDRRARAPAVAAVSSHLENRPVAHLPGRRSSV